MLQLICANTTDVVKNFAVIKSVGLKSFHCIYFLSHKLHEESRSKSRSVSMLQVPLIENSLILNRTLVSVLLPPLFSFMSIFKDYYSII